MINVYYELVSNEVHIIFLVDIKIIVFYIIYSALLQTLKGVG